MSYMSAMRTFAQCADANIEVPGYCHGPLSDAKCKCSSEWSTLPTQCRPALHTSRLSTPIAEVRCCVAVAHFAALANHQVCQGGVTQNIGFHIRIPFNVHVPVSCSARADVCVCLSISV